MSFDIFFQPCRFGGKPVKQKNPFTGRTMSVVPNEPLTAAELKEVRAVLKKAKAKGPDDFGCYVVRTEDGGEAEVQGSDLEQSCMVSLGGLTPGLLVFLVNLMKAGNWVMLPAMEDSVAITCSPEHLQGIPTDFPEVVTCTTADELGVLLTKGIRAWKKYRDQVVGDGGNDVKTQRGRK